MRKILSLIPLCILFFSGFVTGQVTITGTTTGINFASATGGAFVFGVRNTNTNPILITDYANYTETGVTATYTLWTKPTPVTGAPGAITAANGWTQIAGPYTLPAAQPTGITPMFSGINFQVPANTTYRFAIVGAGGNSPYYATANSGANIFSAGNVDVLSQDNAASQGYGGVTTGPGNTPRGFYGAITFELPPACTIPVAGTTVSSVATVCSGSNINLSLTGSSFATGLTYTWQSSPTMGGTYTNISTSTTSGSFTTIATTTAYYRAAVSCNGGTPVFSTPVLVNVNPQLAGNTYTINNTLATGGLNFASFTDAFNALSCGVSGKAIFNVSAGQVFNENPPELIGSGTVTDSIIFRKFGAGSNPVISPVTPGTIASSTTLGSNGDAIVTINGGDYITFDGIDLQANAGFTSGVDVFEYGYYLKKKSATDGCKNVTIKNSVITLNKAIFSFGIFVSNNSGTTTSLVLTSTGGRSENIKISGNTISGGYGGIMARGYVTATPYDLYDQNLQIGVDSANTISDIGGGATVAYGIYTIYQNNLKVSGNTINSSTAGQTGILYGILTSTAVNASGDINNNTVTLTGTGTTTAIYAISNDMGGTGTSNTVRIFNNTITGCTYPTATTGGMYLIDQGASAFNVEIFGNALSANNHTPTTTGLFYCLYQVGAVVNGAKIYNNIISDNVKATGTTGVVYGIYNNGATATAKNETYNNIISNLSSTGTTAILYGIYITAGLENRIYKNKLSGIINTASTTGGAYGIALVSGATNVVYNNFISDVNALTASSATEPVRGISITSATASSTNNIAFNTIFLQGSTSGANFSSAGIYHTTSTTVTTSTLNLNNNIVVNMLAAAGTGYSSAIRRSSATLTNFGASSNNNLYYVNNGPNNVIFYDGANSDATLPDYKIRVSPRETASVTENPLFVNSTAAPYDLHINLANPTQIESGGAPVTGITDDIDGNVRNASTPDIGADEFAGTAVDITGPSIAFTSVPTNSICIDAKTITATITDATGVNVAAGTKPRLWFKKSTENNALPATNTAAANGWKWVESISNTSPFTFNFNFALLSSPLANGDSISYFIAAQDVRSTPNVGVNNATFSNVPASVALAAEVFPVTGPTPGFKILALPNPIAIKADKTELCLSGTVTLNVDGVNVSGGSYQWQSSPKGANNFANISGATTIPYTTASVSDSTDFRLVVSCSGTPVSSSPSPIVTVNVNKPMVLNTTPGFTCGTGTVTLRATGSSGTTLNWYANNTGGIPIGTGSPFTTPVISTTTTFYVSSASGASTVTAGRTTPLAASTGFAGNDYGLIFDATQPFTLQSVEVYPTSTTTGSVTIELANSAGTVISTAGPFALPIGTGTTFGGGATPITLTLNFAVPAGTGYELRTAAHTGNLIRDNPITAFYSYPLPIGSVGTITAGLLAGAPSAAAYYYFFNIQVATGCESPRVAVVATVNNDPNCTVPVTLLSFTGEKRGNYNKLLWSTATELNNSGFELQRSADGVNFSKVGFLASKASNGNSTAVLNYSFDDITPLKGYNYYRIKQIDKDGKATFTNVVALKGDIANSIQILAFYPNPVKDRLNLKIEAPSMQKVTIIVTDALGKTITQQQAQLIGGENRLQLPTQQLAQGSYFVKVVCTAGCPAAIHKFIKE